MDKEKIMILGAGGMGREVLAYYKDLGLIDNVEGFVEQHSARSGQLVKGKRIFDESELPSDRSSLELIAGIGSPLRRKWVEVLEANGFVFDTLIHKEAYVGEDVIFGRGCIVCPGAVITTDVRVGSHCIVNVNASISHDCSIGDFITVCPGATVGGSVEIGDNSWIGIGSTIIQKVKIGRGVYIGAGAVVVDDVPDNSLVVGVPAKVVRKLTPESWKSLI